MIIFLALAFFFLVVGFIIKRRVLDKVAGGVGWWVGGTFKILTGRGKKRVVQKVANSLTSSGVIGEPTHGLSMTEASVAAAVSSKIEL